MRADQMVTWFMEDWRTGGGEFALLRLRRKLPFCREVHAVAGHLAAVAEEMRRLRRVCRLLIALALTGLGVSVAVILDPTVPENLRLLYCFASSTGLMAALYFIRHLPRLDAGPFLAAAECSLLYLEDDPQHLA
ncbi:MAG TPA: hypothetical protein VNX25_05085 [Verrucomicrobiae bacterium]|nr:hypothetical protein [Verrucomicrobiae bacterium]